MPTPDAMKNAPELWPGLDFYLTAFFDLDSQRSNGEHISPIPWLAAEQYCDVFKLSETEKYEFHRIIRMVDQAHMSKVASKRKAEFERMKVKAK